MAILDKDIENRVEHNEQFHDMKTVKDKAIPVTGRGAP
jgi:hypothetical protein